MIVNLVPILAALRGGVKQQKFIMQAVETRTAEVEKLKQDVQELQTVRHLTLWGLNNMGAALLTFSNEFS